MNKVIIIGNGFDLAHGLKTSYDQFMLYHIQDSFQKAVSERVYQTPLGSFRYLQELYKNNPPDLTGWGFSDYERYACSLDQLRQGREDQPFFWHKKEGFVGQICADCLSFGWVDIEDFYYQNLKLAQAVKDKGEKQTAITGLNAQMEYLRNRLCNYLATLSIPRDEQFNKVFFQKFDESDFCEPNLISVDREPAHSMVLNFNYTRTAVKGMMVF